MANETFAPGWLALREPVDHRSRALELIPPLVSWWRAHDASRVVDLGTGSGSNLRYLAPRLPRGQCWTLLDHDSTLLRQAADAETSSLSAVSELAAVEGDLAHEGLQVIRDADLITASALLDLVSQDWLDRLVESCAKTRSAALFALSWDGTMSWRVSDHGPVDPGDALVRDAVRAHQRRDKGLGPALGPAAGAAAERAFRKHGFATWMRPSNWQLGPDDDDLASALVDEWEKAAVEQNPAQEPQIRAWADRRRADTRDPGFGLLVGHVDLLALPPAEGSR